MQLSLIPQQIQRSPALGNLAGASTVMPRSLAKSGIWPAPRQQPSRTLGARSALPNPSSKRSPNGAFKPPGRGRGYTPAASRPARASMSQSFDEEDADQSMGSGASTPDEDDFSDDEEFEVAIDEDCPCAPCRWNLERSKQYPD